MDKIAKAEHHRDDTYKTSLLIKMVTKDRRKFVNGEKPDAYQTKRHHCIDNRPH